MYEKILVTGGAGFIGSHLVDALIELGLSVRVLDNLDRQVHPHNKLPSYFNKKAEFIRGDVTNKKDWEGCLQGVDAVFHFASAVGVGQSMYEIAQYTRVNSFGTALLLNHLANQKHMVKKMIIAASMSSYGEGMYMSVSGEHIQPALRPDKQMEKRNWEPVDSMGHAMKQIPTPETARQIAPSIYAINKKNQEEMMLSIGKAYGIPTVSLRFFNVYGSRQSLSNPYTGVAAIFMSRIKNNNPPVINEDGLQSRDFVHVSDIIAANIAALTSEKANYETFNVGSGKSTSIKQVAQVLIKLHGSDVQPEITGKFRKADVRHCTADITKIQEVLGWKPTVSFENGMKKLIAWAEDESAQDTVNQAMEELEKRGLR